MTLFIMNSPIITNFGAYQYRKITIDEAKEIIKESDKFKSVVGHDCTADFISTILGVNVPKRRVQIKMREGDSAIVFAFKDRLPENKKVELDEIYFYEFHLGHLKMVKEF